MLDGTYFFECDCGSHEHTLRFTADKSEDDPGIHTSIFLNDWRPWHKRFWVAIKYAFGYKCKYGHWDSWILREEDAKLLRSTLDDVYPGDRLFDALDTKILSYELPEGATLERQTYQGKDWWIIRGATCDRMSKSGEFSYEPMNSNKTEEWIRDHTFANSREAYEAYKKTINKAKDLGSCDE
jgi:hypothetical protein